MGYPTTIQLIQRKDSHQWYVNFPAELAQRMGFSKGEILEWTLINAQCLVLMRKAVTVQDQDPKKKALCSRA
jgi:hypothetical protein